MSKLRLPLGAQAVAAVIGILLALYVLDHREPRWLFVEAALFVLWVGTCGQVLRNVLQVALRHHREGRRVEREQD